MKRYLNKIQMGDKKVMEVVRVESDPTPGPEEGARGYQALWNFITSLQTNPTLLRHSVDCPADYRFSYLGTSWVVESHAIVPNSPDV